MIFPVQDDRRHVKTLESYYVGVTVAQSDARTVRWYRERWLFDDGSEETGWRPVAGAGDVQEQFVLHKKLPRLTHVHDNWINHEHYKAIVKAREASNA